MLQGYKIDAEGSSPTANIELNPDGKTAAFLIDEGQGCIEVTLDYDEICELFTRVRNIKSEMEWNQAQYIATNAKYTLHAKTHLVQKTEALHTVYQRKREITLGTTIEEREATTLCGKSAPEPLGWDLTPIPGQPHDGYCKRCMVIYRNSLKEENLPKDLPPIEDTLGDIDDGPEFKATPSEAAGKHL
jgi:hypothetical protein